MITTPFQIAKKIGEILRKLYVNTGDFQAIAQICYTYEGKREAVYINIGGSDPIVEKNQKQLCETYLSQMLKIKGRIKTSRAINKEVPFDSIVGAIKYPEGIVIVAANQGEYSIYEETIVEALYQLKVIDDAWHQDVCRELGAH